MFDVALSSAGAQVALATSCDENYPPENMIDGKSETFWMSTGLFPQEAVVTFQSLMNVNTIKLESTAIRKLRIERSVQSEPVDFEVVTEKEIDGQDGGMQSEEIDMPGTTAVHLRLVIEAAHDHFISVHKFHVDGTAVH